MPAACRLGALAQHTRTAGLSLRRPAPPLSTPAANPLRRRASAAAGGPMATPAAARGTLAHGVSLLNQADAIAVDVDLMQEPGAPRRPSTPPLCGTHRRPGLGCARGLAVF